MFKRLYVDNYKCFVNFELPLQELSLLLGPNGVGKTSVFDVIFALRQLLRGEAKVTDPEAFPTRTLTRWQLRHTQVFEIELRLENDELMYRLEVQHEPETRRARIMLERLSTHGKPLFRFEKGEVQLYRDDHREGPKYHADWEESALARVPPRGESNVRLTRFLEFVRNVMVCGLQPASFEAESKSEDRLLYRDAHNFAAWYHHVYLEQPELVSELTKELQEIIEGFRGIRLEREGEYTRKLMVTFEHEEGERYELRFDEISDGQRALLALYAMIRLAGGQGYTLFLDEPDNYVELAEIQPLLVELSDSCGETAPQAVLSSHHPELIDYLGPDRGLLLSRESGVTTIKPVSEIHVDGGLRLSESLARGWQR